MASHKICTRIFAHARSRHTLTRRHQSTFSFFSRSQDSIPSPLLADASASKTAADKDADAKNLASQFPQYPHALKTSSSYANAAPLLAAIQSKDQDTAWMVYSVLSRAGQLSSLLPIHHTLLLQSIRPENPIRYTRREAATLTERFEQVWTGMLQCHIQPNMNDYTARLELFVGIRQYHLVDSTWTEMREKAVHATDAVAAAGSSSGNGTLIQPTLHTYNLVLQSCVSRKNIGLALETINGMRRAGVKPDTMSWDFILQIHTAMKNWQAVETTFRTNFITTSMGATGSQHNQSSSFSEESMVIPLGQRARSLHGGALTSKSNKSTKVDHKEKLTPSLQNIHTLFSYYAYTQDLEDLRAMFDSHVRLFGLVPTTRTYNEMIKFAFLARRDGDAMDLFRELVQIGQNLERVKSSGNAQVQKNVESSAESEAHTGTSTAGQVCGPDFDTFKILINNELIASRNRWGRAAKWIKIMQEGYNLEPSDPMFRRTLAAMKRRRGVEAEIQALQENWDLVRARRSGLASQSARSQDEEEKELAVSSH
ncbi:hypothetical protein BG015_010992 [Linnemannia schmuckeri]|uniref:Pentatricopeptide repeat protein n=1 Tax=Linnemannia schmuckeri TaxID=64567 RepID=A0A9P5S4U3_9FUNG|nr:hypothetical protein BG015_010992 [Linnemannia schmuckeri]